MSPSTEASQYNKDGTNQKHSTPSAPFSLPFVMTGVLLRVGVRGFTGCFGPVPWGPCAVRGVCASRSRRSPASRRTSHTASTCGWTLSPGPLPGSEPEGDNKFGAIKIIANVSTTSGPNFFVGEAWHCIEFVPNSTQFVFIVVACFYCTPAIGQGGAP